jgi:hypothetical protein
LFDVRPCAVHVASTIAEYEIDSTTPIPSAIS